jgi:hypothetical protein
LGRGGQKEDLTYAAFANVLFNVSDQEGAQAAVAMVWTHG